MSVCTCVCVCVYAALLSAFGCTSWVHVYSLDPLLDVFEFVHRDGVDHRDLLAVVLEDEDHVEVLEVELHALEVHEFDLIQCDHERRLQRTRNKPNVKMAQIFLRVPAQKKKKKTFCRGS